MALSSRGHSSFHPGDPELDALDEWRRTPKGREVSPRIEALKGQIIIVGTNGDFNRGEDFESLYNQK